MWIQNSQTGRWNEILVLFKDVGSGREVLEGRAGTVGQKDNGEVCNLNDWLQDKWTHFDFYLCQIKESKQCIYSGVTQLCF